MNQVVIVHFFGKFCLETDIGYLDEEKGETTLQYYDLQHGALYEIKPGR